MSHQNGRMKRKNSASPSSSSPSGNVPNGTVHGGEATDCNGVISKNTGANTGPDPIVYRLVLTGGMSPIGCLPHALSPLFHSHRTVQWKDHRSSETVHFL